MAPAMDASVGSAPTATRRSSARGGLGLGLALTLNNLKTKKPQAFLKTKKPQAFSMTGYAFTTF